MNRIWKLNCVIRITLKMGLECSHIEKQVKGGKRMKLESRVYKKRFEKLAISYNSFGVEAL